MRVAVANSNRINHLPSLRCPDKRARILHAGTWLGHHVGHCVTPGRVMRRLLVPRRVLIGAVDLDQHEPRGIVSSVASRRNAQCPAPARCDKRCRSWPRRKASTQSGLTCTCTWTINMVGEPFRDVDKVNAGSLSPLAACVKALPAVFPAVGCRALDDHEVPLAPVLQR